MAKSFDSSNSNSNKILSNEGLGLERELSSPHKPEGRKDLKAGILSLHPLDLGHATVHDAVELLDEGERYFLKHEVDARQGVRQGVDGQNSGQDHGRFGHSEVGDDEAGAVDQDDVAAADDVRLIVLRLSGCCRHLQKN